MNTAVQVNTSEEPRYTYSEWKGIEAERKKRIEARKAEIRRSRKSKFAYYAIQKVAGLLIIAASIALTVCVGDATADLLLIPTGLYLIVTSERVFDL